MHSPNTKIWKMAHFEKVVKVAEPHYARCSTGSHQQLLIALNLLMRMKTRMKDVRDFNKMLWVAVCVWGFETWRNDSPIKVKV